MSIKKIAGQVKLWNTLGGTAPDGYNNIEFSEIALKTDVAAAVEGAVVPETNGFTITAGTTPKTLTVALDADVSGTNTGDETAETIKTTLGAADTETDGYLTSEDWNTFNNKQDELSAADTETDGYLTSEDWNTFNGKQDELSAASTDTDGYLTSTDWNTFNDKQDELSAADTETDGYLTSEDWNTFNDKQAANTKQDLLDTLGIPGPYDDDTAAGTGGVAVGGLYYVTTTLVLQVKVS